MQMHLATTLPICKSANFDFMWSRVLANLVIFPGIFLEISLENGVSWLERWLSMKLSGISLRLSGISVSQAS